ncbi:hypothetical protein AB0872_13750 [Microbacterium sp. NPDC047426]
MNTKAAHSIDDRELSLHGIRRVGDHPGLRSRVRSSGGVLLLGMGGATSELTVDTVSAYPDHSVFAFLEAQAHARARGPAHREPPGVPGRGPGTG